MSYPKKVNGKNAYVLHPVKIIKADQARHKIKMIIGRWMAVEVLPKHYRRLAEPQQFVKREECQAHCDAVNINNGYEKEWSLQIVAQSQGLV